MISVVARMIIASFFIVKLLLSDFTYVVYVPDVLIVTQEHFKVNR
jgi:hypothetical protein